MKPAIMKTLQLITTLPLIVTLSACLAPSPEKLKESLFTAVKSDDGPTVQALIKQGADVKSPEAEGGWSALHYAAWNGNVEIVSMLLASGADPTYVGAASGQPGPTHISLKPAVVAQVQMLKMKDDPKAKGRYERVIQILNEATRRN
jgi:ankyrin repeat protein